MINNDFLSIITIVINFIHIIAASMWLAGTIIILTGNKIQLNKNIYSHISHQYKNWTNTLLSILVITGVIYKMMQQVASQLLYSQQELKPPHLN